MPPPAGGRYVDGSFGHEADHLSGQHGTAAEMTDRRPMLGYETCALLG